MPINILTYSNLYPNASLPTHGLFVEQRLLKLVDSGRFSATVVAPVPWFPFTSPKFGGYAKFARVPEQDTRYGIDILHPRYPVIPKIGTQIAPWLMASFTRTCIRKIIDDIDLVDGHYLYPDGVAAVTLARFFDKPVVLTARGSDVNVIAQLTGPRKRILKAIEMADGVVTVSQALRERLVDLGVSGRRVSVLPNGVDQDSFRPLDREKIRSEKSVSGDLILSVGNLVPLKGHHLVIEALAQMDRGCLWIIGDGPERNRLEALVKKLALGHRVRFVGTVANEQMATYYNAADVTVLASEREGMPNVVLESLACGTPVVASAVGGIPEVVEGPVAGNLLATRSTDAIKSTLSELLHNKPDRESTRVYASRFRWDRTIDSLGDLMARIVEKRSNV